MKFKKCLLLHVCRARAHQEPGGQGRIFEHVVNSRGDSLCLCFPGIVVEDVVHSGQKMAEEALFPVK